MKGRKQKAKVTVAVSAGTQHDPIQIEVIPLSAIEHGKEKVLYAICDTPSAVTGRLVMFNELFFQHCSSLINRFFINT